VTEEFAQRPEHGGRLLAKWSSEDAQGVVYAVGVADPSGDWVSTARVGEDGEVVFEAWSAAPPEWLERALYAMLRSVWQGRRAGLAWPRRLSRWRPTPEAGEIAEVE
jgi:hypothetical protein